MAAGVHGVDTGTMPAGRSRDDRDDDALPVDGELPSGIDGCFLQAGPHPLGPAGGGTVVTGPTLLAGVRLDGAGARRYRARVRVCRSRPLGPVPALAPTLWLPGPGAPGPDDPGIVSLARPVREAGAAEWHTVATYPGMDRAEHIIAGPDGTVVHSESFPLDGAPLMHAVALTRRYVVLLDLPVAYSRAAALVGTRLPYTWRPDRPARIGLLPRETDRPRPRWLPIEPCYVFHAVNAYDRGGEVVLDAIRHPRAFAPASTGPGRLCRWILDPAAGTVRTSLLAGPLEYAVVDGRVRGRRHRYVFGAVNDPVGGAMIIRHDVVTGDTRATALGWGRRAGEPVFVPDALRADEGAGRLMVVIRSSAHRHCELRVLDLSGPGERRGTTVRLPGGLPAGGPTAWIPAGALA